jgi:hypothetical protein
MRERNASDISHVKRKWFTLVYNLHIRPSNGMADCQFIEHVGIAAREVRHDHSVFHYVLNYLAGDDSGLSDFVSTQGCEPTLLGGGFDDVLQHLIGSLADWRIRFPDWSNYEASCVGWHDVAFS